MSKNLGIALIGGGYIGRAHALAYSSVNRVFEGLPKLKKVMVVDRDAALAEKFSAKFDFEHHATCWRSAIDRADVDIVAIATPNDTHKDIALAALDAGKHVYCEKPLSGNLQDAEIMAAAAAQKSTTTMVGYNYRTNPMIQLAVKLIKDGIIGRPHFIRGVNDEGYLASPDVEFSWRCDASHSGLGVSADLLPHLIQISEMLMGPIETLTGNFQTSIATRKDSEGIERSVENDDICSAITKFKNGARGELSSSRVSWGRTNRLAFEIQAENGAILFDQERMNELQLFTTDATAERLGFSKIQAGPTHPPYDAFVQSSGHQIGFNDLKTIEVRDLLHAIGNDFEAPCSFADALRTERVFHALAHSARVEQPVTI